MLSSSIGIALERSINSVGQIKGRLKLQREKRSELPKPKQETNWGQTLGRKKAGENGGERER